MSEPHLFSGELVRSRRIIYQPSHFAQESLLHLQEAGSLIAIRPHVSSRKNLASYLFFLVTEGEGTLIYQGRSYALAAGDCVFIDCRKEYSQCSSSDNLWSLKWVHFNGSTMNGIYSKYLERGGSCVQHNCACDKINSVLDEIYETANTFSYVRDMRINQSLASLLSLIMEQSWNPGAARRTGTKKLDTSAVRNYIDTAFTRNLSLEKVAAKFYVNKSYLLRSFRDDFGITVNNYILHKRILMAKNELRFTDGTLDVIAENCGFGEANYFIRQFKKVEGITPGDYRRQWVLAGK